MVTSVPIEQNAPGEKGFHNPLTTTPARPSSSASCSRCTSVRGRGRGGNREPEIVSPLQDGGGGVGGVADDSAVSPWRFRRRLTCMAAIAPTVTTVGIPPITACPSLEGRPRTVGPGLEFTVRVDLAVAEMPLESVTVRVIVDFPVPEGLQVSAIPDGGCNLWALPGKGAKKKARAVC